MLPRTTSLVIGFLVCFLGVFAALTAWHLYNDHLLIDQIRQNSIQQMQQQMQQMQQQQRPAAPPGQ